MSQARPPEDKNSTPIDIEKINNKLVESFKHITDTEKAKQLAGILIKKIEKLSSPSTHEGEIDDALKSVISSVDELIVDVILRNFLNNQDELFSIINIALITYHLNPGNDELQEDLIIQKTKDFFAAIQNLLSLKSIPTQFKLERLQELTEAYVDGMEILFEDSSEIVDALARIGNAKFYFNIAGTIGEYINQTPLPHETIHSNFFSKYDTDENKPNDQVERSALLNILNDEKPSPSISPLNERIISAFADCDVYENNPTSPISSLNNSSTLFSSSTVKTNGPTDQDELAKKPTSP